MTEDEAEARDQKIIELKVAGSSTAQVCSLLGCGPFEVMRALDNSAHAALSAQSRVRTIHVEQLRLEKLEPVFLKQAATGDCQSALVLVRLQERKASLLGLNAPIHAHIDPVQLALEAAPKQSSVDAMLEAIGRLKAEDKRRLRNGGAGYGAGSWQDLPDREEMAREAKAEVEE